MDASILFEDFEEAFHNVFNNTFEQASEKYSKEAYLQRGERIESLARQHFEKELKEISFSSFEEMLFAPSLKEWSTDLGNEVAKSVIRPILRRSKDADDAMLNQVVDFINRDMPFRLSIKKAVPDEYVGLHRFLKKMDPAEWVMKMTLEEDGFEELLVISRSHMAQAKGRKDISLVSGRCWADAGLFLSNLVIFSLVLRETKKVKERNQEDEVASEVHKFLSEMHDKGIRNVISGFKCKEELYCNKDWFYHLPIYVWDRNGDLPVCLRRVVLLVKKEGYKVHEIKDIPELRNVRELIGNDAGMILSRDSLPFFLGIFFSDIWDHVRYHDLVSCNRGSFWPQISCGFNVLYGIFEILLKINQRKVKSIQYIRSLKDSYAKSYQQKKNIPQKVISAMEASEFNNSFGYVEFDELVDLDKINIIQKQYQVFKDTYFRDLDIKDNAIRFRRLGNHKAAGLYYPFLKCLCVDIHNPSSLIHEFGHLLDFELGGMFHGLSSRAEFRNVRNRYEFLLRSNPSIAEQKGKYNLDYFLEPTEIFARSFEVYMAKCMEMDNSLLPDSFSEVYPISDETYMEAVKTYFDWFMKSAVKVAA